MRFKKWMAVGALLAVSAPVVAQTLVNGDFEQGPSVGWTMWSNPAGQGLIGTGNFFASTEISPAVTPRSGNWMGRVGGFSYAENALSRMIALPNVRPVYVGFWYQTRSSAGTECTPLWSTRIRVVIAGQVITDTNICQYSDVYQWTYGYYDVSAVSGQTIEFGIRADAPNSLWAFLYVDDFVMTTSTSVDSEPLGVLPELFALDAAFPNPFTAETRIPVELPTPTTVRLSVFDALGRLVSSPADEVLPAGRHQLKFDGSSLPPGVYFGRVEAGSASRTVKLVRGN